MVPRNSGQFVRPRFAIRIRSIILFGSRPSARLLQTSRLYPFAAHRIFHHQSVQRVFSGGQFLEGRRSPKKSPNYEWNPCEILVNPSESQRILRVPGRAHHPVGGNPILRGSSSHPGDPVRGGEPREVQATKRLPLYDHLRIFPRFFGLSWEVPCCSIVVLTALRARSRACYVPRQFPLETVEKPSKRIEDNRKHRKPSQVEREPSQVD